ncbi:MAG TPA: hypothetical protein PLU54_07900 [Deltaproteobacteria bacterium]|nr:hypothetical protein [Deltaproteobacteria bacterium]
MVSAAVRTWVEGLNPSSRAASSAAGTARITANPVSMTGCVKYALTALPVLPACPLRKTYPAARYIVRMWHGD